MPSVSEILALPALALVPITLPHPDAAIRWVATSELPDPAPYLEGGELLLTTGLVDRSAEGWAQYARGLLGAGVVALGFGVEVNHPEVPAALAAVAAELGLNLFAVPKPTPFIAVSKAVADAIAAAERDLDRRSLAHQRALTNAALAGPASLVAELGRIVGTAAVLAPDGEPLLGAASAIADRAHPHIERLRASTRRGAVAEIGVDDRMLVQAVELRGRVEGYLVIETSTAFEAPERVAVSTALALLTLDRDRARVERDAERRIRAGAVSLLLQGDAAGASAVFGRLPWTRARVVRASGAPDALEAALVLIERDSDALAAVLAEGDLVAITAEEPALGDAVRIGVGSLEPLAELSASDTAARDALAATSTANPVVRWGDLANRGFDSVMPPESVATFARTLLAPVLNRPDAAQLLGVVRTFLKHNGQVGPVAAELGMHRNTVRNRLTLAEDLIGRSLHDPQARADLWVALKNGHR